MAQTNRFLLELDDEDDLVVTNMKKETKKVNQNGVFFVNEQKKVIFESDSTTFYRQFDECFTECFEKVNKMQITHVQRNEIFNICASLIQKANNLGKNLSSSEDSNGFETAHEYALSKIKSVTTRRKRENHLKQLPTYASPKEKAISVKWNTKRQLDSDLPTHLLIPTTFYYVPIKETLESLFAQPLLVETFMSHNTSHVCVPGIYKYFCCAENYKLFDIYRNSNVVQIRIGMDECELSNPLKTKTGKHKLMLVYFQIANLPPTVSSKLDNIYLVALAKTEDLKQDEAYFNNIAVLMVDDLKKLETIGFEVKAKESVFHWKAALTDFSFDNLGGCTVLGMPENFNHDYYCRICECKKSECQTLVRELENKIRSKTQYLSYFENHGRSDEIDINVTKGFKNYCVFNDLENYNIFDNLYGDVMHDVFEGLIPTFIEHFFEYCTAKKIIGKTKIVQMVRDFNYCAKHKQTWPSLVKFNRAKLNQSASQCHTLMMYLPFIFFDYRDKLKQVWPIMESLLFCTQIICSSEIREFDILKFEEHSERHLTGMKDVFGMKLKPKQHIFTHYARIIRRQGPMICRSMMRMEAKHRFFTEAAKRTRNFVNIGKTLAEHHQLYISSCPFTLPQIEKSKLNQNKVPKNADYMSDLRKYFNSRICLIEEIKFFTFNSQKFAPGLFLIEKLSVFYIRSAIVLDESFFLVCKPYKVKKFVIELNSIQIEESNTSFSILNFIDLQNKKTYEKIIHNGELHIIADTLDVYKENL